MHARAAPTSARRVVLAASTTLTVGVLPVFLVGSLSDEMGGDLGFGPTGTGAAVTVFFASAGVTAVATGRITDRAGSRTAMRAGVALAGACTLALGALVAHLWQLIALLGLAGTSIGLIDTGGARSFALAIRPARQGLAFGVKEASVPMASMLAGFSLPLFAEALGWRWVFVLGAALAPLVWLVVPADVPADVTGGSTVPRPEGEGRPSAPTTGRAGRTRRTRAPRSGSLVVFAVGVALGAGASSAAATLFVPAVTDAGWTEAAAGALLAVASVASMATRLGLGWTSDLRPGRIPAMLVGSLSLGAGGAVLLAVSSGPIVVVAGALGVLGAGWGWSGLAFLHAVRTTPRAPSVAAGVVLTGLAAGGSVGPVVFGVVAARWSYAASWWTAAGALALAAAVALTAGVRRVDDRLGTRAAGDPAPDD
jgi:MFS family permease